MESEAEMEEIRRFRRPTVIAVIVIFVAAMIVWPLLMLPAGDLRSNSFPLSVAWETLMLQVLGCTSIATP